jgi:hypothetical protein
VSITSTVPAAAATLAAYMQAVADANPALNPGVYVGGIPTATVRDNFLMVGNYAEGIIVAPETYSWAAVPGMAKLRLEAYALFGCIRVWTGAAGTDASLARLGEAFTLLNGLHQEIVDDLGGDLVAVDSLTSSGSWGDLDVTMEINGPIGTKKGWGVVLQFELHVINAQLIG